MVVSGDELFLSGYDERVARSSFVLLRRTCPRFKDAPADSFDSYSGVNPVLEYGLVQAEFAGDCILISMSVIIVCPKENLLNLSLILRYNLF